MLNNSLNFIFAAGRIIHIDGHIILRVKGIFHTHITGNTAHIDVTIDCSAVRTIRNLTQRDQVNIDLTAVDDHIVFAIAHDQFKTGFCDLIDLGPDQLHIGLQFVGSTSHLSAKHTHLTGHTAQRRCKATQIGCNIDLSLGIHASGCGRIAASFNTAGDRPADFHRNRAISHIDTSAGTPLGRSDSNPALTAGFTAAGNRTGNRTGSLDILCCSTSTAHSTCNAVQPLYNGIRCTICVFHCSIQQDIKLVKLPLELCYCAFRKILGNVRLHLSCDTAHILTAKDFCRILAAVYIAAVPAYNAAHIVANVRITNGCLVFAALDDAGGITGNAAGIHSCRTGIQRGQLGVVRQKIKGNILRVDGRVNTDGIDISLVFAADHDAQIATRNAAGHIRSKDRTAGLAPGNLACQRIHTGDTARVAGTDNTACKGAVCNGAIIFTHDAADKLGITTGSYSTADGQILNDTCCAQLPEKTGRSYMLSHVQTADHVAVTVKDTAEGGDGQKVCIVQRKIRFQNHQFSYRPGIQTAVFCQFQKVFCIFDIYGFKDFCYFSCLRRFRRSCFFFRSGGECRHCNTQHQDQCQKECKYSVILHRLTLLPL